jgi:hypothetical protein
VVDAPQPGRAGRGLEDGARDLRRDGPGWVDDDHDHEHHDDDHHHDDQAAADRAELAARVPAQVAAGIRRPV